jgi:uncharacterized membrane protein YuzA (DUF378 family)
MSSTSSAPVVVVPPATAKESHSLLGEANMGLMAVSGALLIIGGLNTGAVAFCNKNYINKILKNPQHAKMLRMGIGAGAIYIVIGMLIRSMERLYKKKDASPASTVVVA